MKSVIRRTWQRSSDCQGTTASETGISKQQTNDCEIDELARRVKVGRGLSRRAEIGRIMGGTYLRSSALVEVEGKGGKKGLSESRLSRETLFYRYEYYTHSGRPPLLCRRADRCNDHNEASA